ncbi:glycosyltransferase [Thioclava indica]|uniref:Glycosyl transferase family 1 domain-containing protein n=1 Tax=Thioclava indica TaxID=1353528 RepID=A0A074JWA0_9RHOB|nr:hypothetical protein [Thioclava indica]KEO59883.1 hypothetical protein DT23_15580 [Thioclava indica]
MTASVCDVTLVTDPRFSGGTAQAFASDVRAFLGAGMRVGVHFHHSGQFFQDSDTDNRDLIALLALDGIEISPSRTQTLFLHNPQVFGAAQIAASERPLRLPKCERLFMVAHHPPFLGNGALCYDPVSTGRALGRCIGHARRMEWLPVSGLVRAQLRSFQPLIALAPEDWPNCFDITRWVPSRTRLSGPDIVIGRHGRAHPDKWPDTPAQIAASLPAGPHTQVQVLGADPEFFTARGIDTSDWVLLPFGAIDPVKFLDQLDLFSYFHSSGLREAFGRTVAEAMMMGLPCLLDQHLRPTFGANATYARPDEVPAMIERIRSDPAPHLDRAAQAAAWCRAQFSSTQVVARYTRLMAAASLRFERGDRSSPPGVTLKKWVGFHRRARSTRIAT